MSSTNRTADETTPVTTTDQLKREPMTVRSRGRIYTSQYQRRRLGIHGPGTGTEVLVKVYRSADVDECEMLFVAKLTTTLGTYGEFTIPAVVREQFNLSEGDAVLVSLSIAD